MLWFQERSELDYYIFHFGIKPEGKNKNYLKGILKNRFFEANKILKNAIQ
jgi:hypothetical protein